DLLYLRLHNSKAGPRESSWKPMPPIRDAVWLFAGASPKVARRRGFKEPVMPANTYVENAWYVAGRSSEFPVNEPKGLKIAGRPVLVGRTKDGKVASFDDRCVHKRMPLSEGVVREDGVLECPYHGFCYDSKGQCVRIPSQLDQPIPTRA